MLGLLPPDAPGLALIDRACAVREARRFKLDVSCSLPLGGGEGAIRFSVNDKGEPVAFRERLRAVLPGLGAPPAILEALLAVAAPGRVQTTAAVKLRGSRVERVTLYLEELRPDDVEIARAFFRAAGAVGLGEPCAAVSVDLAGGRIVGLRDYVLVEEGDLPVDVPALAAWRARLPRHPFAGTLRFLVARRHGFAGEHRGAKLLWMTESHRPETAAMAWRAVDALAAAYGVDPGEPVAASLAALRAGWRHAPACFLHPDLVSLDVDAAGEARASIVYVSVR
ncbi:MAG: hypothetical protein ACOZNI_14540 [Myxococcota bacterium]